jgi:outer membrane protein TolC
MKLILLFFIFLGILPANAQLKIFTEKELVAAVLKYHPVAKQADIGVSITRTGILSAKGEFDPQVKSESSQKEFDGIAYYRHITNEIRLPVWYGIDLYAGNEKITGSRINPEETTGVVTYLGFSVQPIRHLLMDKRRAALLKARNLFQLSEVQRKIEINDLLRESLNSYWTWWEKYHVQQVIKTALQNAEKRLVFVRTAFRLGERPAMDTVEAYTQVQSFQVMHLEALEKFIKATLEVSSFLWTANGQQFELSLDVAPQQYEPVPGMLLADILNVAQTHPELIQYTYQLNEGKIDKKLAFQSLLPDVQLRYNQTGRDLDKTVNAPWFNNNFRFGISVSMPLRFSQGRGDYQEAKLRIQRVELQQRNKRAQLLIKVRQYYTEWQQTENRLSVQLALLANVNALQKGEEMKFQNGESSLFLVNARELKTIEAEQKVYELRAKAKQAAADLRWSAGMLQ